MLLTEKKCIFPVSIQNTFNSLQMKNGKQTSYLMIYSKQRFSASLTFIQFYTGCFYSVNYFTCVLSADIIKITAVLKMSLLSINCKVIHITLLW